MTINRSITAVAYTRRMMIQRRNKHHNRGRTVITPDTVRFRKNLSTSFHICPASSLVCMSSYDLHLDREGCHVPCGSHSPSVESQAGKLDARRSWRVWKAIVDPTGVVYFRAGALHDRDC